MDENQNENINLNNAQIDSAAPPNANSQENPKQINDNSTEEKSPKKNKTLKVTLISIAAVIVIAAAAFGIWRSQQLVMPNVISKDAGAAVWDVTDLQDPTHEDETKWHVELIDEDGNNLYDLGLSTDELAEKYEVYDTTPAAGELFGKNETVTLYAQKNAATIAAERKAAANKLIRYWHKEFGADSGRYKEKDNCFVFTMKSSNYYAYTGCAWTMEQPEQDNLEAFCNEVKANAFIFIYTKDNYLTASYAATYSGATAEELDKAAAIGDKKISSSKKVSSASKKALKKFCDKIHDFWVYEIDFDKATYKYSKSRVDGSVKLTIDIYGSELKDGGEIVKASKKRFAQVWQYHADAYAYLLGVGLKETTVVKIKYHQDGIVSTSIGKFSHNFYKSE